MKVSVKETYTNNMTKLARHKYEGEIFCPICHALVHNNLGHHIRDTHGEEEFQRAILKAKENGMPDPRLVHCSELLLSSWRKLLQKRMVLTFQFLRSQRG